MPPILVLSALADGPRHGCAIAQEINRRTVDFLRFKQGTLHSVLHTLEREGLVGGEWRHGAGERPRLVAAITDAGRAELARRVQAWKRFAQAMESMIGGPSDGRSGGTPDDRSGVDVIMTGGGVPLTRARTTFKEAPPEQTA